jgi:ABC-type multidrug transport system fused ATPase/permease subunit
VPGNQLKSEAVIFPDVYNTFPGDLKQTIRGILGILNKGERIKLLKLTLLDVLISALDICFLGGLLIIINYYTANNAGGKFLFFSLSHNNHSIFFIAVFLLLFGLKNWVGYLISAAENSFFYNVSARLSQLKLSHYLKDSYTRFVHTDSSVHIYKISQQPIQFSNYILTNVQQLITQIVLILFTVIAILLYHPLLFPLLFLVLLPPIGLLAWFIKRKLSAVRASIKVIAEKAIQYLQESLSGFIESNVYHKNEFFINRYDGYQKQLNNNIATQQSLQGLPARLIEVFAILGFFVLILISRLTGDNRAVNLLNVGVFMAASYKIIPGIVKIFNSAGQIKTYQFIINDLLKTDQDAVENNTSLVMPINSVEFKRVGFKYNNNDILKCLSFEVLPGDFAGISGDSGRGKTTIVNLLLGFLEQDSGGIFINNKPVSTIERQHYWPKISYVKQQSFFINDTLLKNITLADDAYDKARLDVILAFCGIDLMLTRYPEGLNKIITENAKNISGGQRQRVMLARALYHDFDLLILDEPFGELDEVTEKGMMGLLQSLAQQGKMIILITHNNSSLAFCNKVILIDE